MTGVVGVDAIRAAFPAQERRQGDQPVAYLDAPGGTQVPRHVVDTVTDYLLHHNANTHWAYPTSAETDAMLESARATFAEFVNGAPDEIAFGANMTTLTFHVARALARGWAAGDEIIVTELDHHGNVAPWQAVAAERGLTLRWLPIDPDRGVLREEELPSLLSPRTRLVAIGAASNLLGTMPDVPAIAAMARRAGAMVHVDGVHLAPHALPDVAALGADFFVCSAYKFYGPHVGILWCRRAVGEALDVPRLIPAPDTMPERLETGTQNHEGIAGAAAAVNWLASLAPDVVDRRDALRTSYAELHDRSARLFERLWNGVQAIPGSRLYGLPPGPGRTPTLAFTIAGHRSESIARQLAEAGLFVSHGDFYAATAVERIGRRDDGVVRIGLACYSTGVEVDRAVSALRRLAAQPVTSPAD